MGITARGAWESVRRHFRSLGLAVQSVWIIGLVYLLLSFPSGRLPGRLDRCLLAIGVVAARDVSCAMKLA